jgi:hypothetical protein
VTMQTRMTRVCLQASLYTAPSEPLNWQVIGGFDPRHASCGHSIVPLLSTVLAAIVRGHLPADVMSAPLDTTQPGLETPLVSTLPGGGARPRGGKLQDADVSGCQGKCPIERAVAGDPWSPLQTFPKGESPQQPYRDDAQVAFSAFNSRTAASDAPEATSPCRGVAWQRSTELEAGRPPLKPPVRSAGPEAAQCGTAPARNCTGAICSAPVDTGVCVPAPLEAGLPFADLLGLKRRAEWPGSVLAATEASVSGALGSLRVSTSCSPVAAAAQSSRLGGSGAGPEQGVELHGLMNLVLVSQASLQLAVFCQARRCKAVREMATEVEVRQALVAEARLAVDKACCLLRGCEFTAPVIGLRCMPSALHVCITHWCCRIPIEGCLVAVRVAPL